MKKIAFASVALLLISLTSCTKKLADLLPGTWTVSEVKNEPVTGTGTTLTNAGTITFVAGGSGTYSINFGFGITNGSFSWVAADNNANVTITGLNLVAGQYTVLTNKNNRQVWQRLDGDGNKFTYTLDR